MLVGRLTGLGAWGGVAFFTLSQVSLPASDPGKSDDSSILTAHFKEHCFSAAGFADSIPIQIAADCHIFFDEATVWCRKNFFNCYLK